ncbi:hypothetical protein THAOC_33039, partial [Thalassiosira oceanica]
RSWGDAVHTGRVAPMRVATNQSIRGGDAVHTGRVAPMRVATNQLPPFCCPCAAPTASTDVTASAPATDGGDQEPSRHHRGARPQNGQQQRAAACNGADDAGNDLRVSVKVGGALVSSGTLLAARPQNGQQPRAAAGNDLRVSVKVGGALVSSGTILAARPQNGQQPRAAAGNVADDAGIELPPNKRLCRTFPKQQ